MKGSFEVRSVEETWDLARQLAAELGPGDVICLEGDLGAGKTTFTQGLAAALGVRGRVTSPTFCIVQEHAADPSAGGTIPLLVHMDLYRLHGEDDVLAIGWRTTWRAGRRSSSSGRNARERSSLRPRGMSSSTIWGKKPVWSPLTSDVRIMYNSKLYGKTVHKNPLHGPVRRVPRRMFSVGLHPSGVRSTAAGYA